MWSPKERKKSEALHTTLHERFILGLPDPLEARVNFAAVDFEMSPLVVIAFCVPACESKVFQSVVTCLLSFAICDKFWRYVWRICYKGHRWKQVDILVSSVFLILLETLIVSSFFLSFYQKLDFAPDSLSTCCLQSLKNDRVASVQFYIEKSCRVQMFILDLIHQWNDSEVDVLEGDRKDPSERHPLLILLDWLIEDCCPLSPYTQKKITDLVSVCTNLDCMRVEFFQYL